MKAIVHQETLTSKTVEVFKGKIEPHPGWFMFSGFSGLLAPGFFLVGDTTVSMLMLGLAATAGALTFQRNSMQDIVAGLTKKRYTKAELYGMVKDGERVMLGEPRYIESKNDLHKEQPDDLYYRTKDKASYEVKTYLKRSGKKLSIEQEAVELPLTTWEQAFNLILEKERISKASLNGIQVDNPYRYENKRAIEPGEPEQT